MQILSGNGMVARAALDAGCTFFSGYPITPSSEVYAHMMRALPGRGGVAVGTPDEISALSYAVGASLAGARSMTATSGPGWSLMVETFQYAVMTETPVVIVVVQRLGPATGGATQGAQGDVLLVRYATSGGYPVPVLCPVDADDCYRLTADAFRLAEELRTPVVLLSDKEVATTLETVDVGALPPVEVPPRAAAGGQGPFVPYRIEIPEAIPRFAPVGGGLKATVTGSAHDEHGRLRKNDPATIRLLEHLAAKVEARADALAQTRLRPAEGARTLLISYGISARTCRQVQADLGAEGVPVASLEVLSLFPVPAAALRAAVDGVERVVVVEENGPGLYAKELASALPGVELTRVNKIGGMITPAEIAQAVQA